MQTTLLKAPLIELVAEVRWNPEATQPISQYPVGGNPQFVALGGTTKSEEFFMRFGAEVARLNYPATERLVPPGFPPINGQPVYRFRKQAQGDLTSLYQVGTGLFTANAVPPYQTWDQFCPVVKDGVMALISSRPESEKKQPFTVVSLRYIDAFGPELTLGKNIGEFMESVLGISIKLPDGLLNQLAPSSTFKPTLQLQIPMLGGLIMNIGVGEGIANNKPTIIMDTTVATTVAIAANAEAVMASLNLARNAIHDVFFAVTKPIIELMRPTEVN
jgi:uncharacterized protein (TIGR04255 family)